MVEIQNNITTKEKETVRAGGHYNLNHDTAAGVLTALGIILLTWGFFWWQDYKVMGFSKKLKVLFPEVAGLRANAPVQMNGLKIGLVQSLEWQGVEKILVRIKITSSEIKIPKDSKFRILANGIIGAKYVEIVIPDKPGQPFQEIDESQIIEGEPPVRPELAVNKLALGLSEINPKKLVENYREDRRRINRAADQLAILAEKSMPAIEEGIVLEKELIPLIRTLNALTRDLKTMAEDAPNSEVRKTITLAQNTIQDAHSVILEVKSIVKDEELRKSLNTTMKNLNRSSRDIRTALVKAENLVEDGKLKDDTLEVLNKTERVLTKADNILNKPILNKDLKQTIDNVDQAVDHIDLAARQMNSILDKRFPLVHLMLGRPGHLEEEEHVQSKSD